MHDVLDELYKRWSEGETVGVGTVVATFSSAPRAPGASMLVGEDGAVVGSVSGGCVEGAVYELARQVDGDAEPVLQRYGVSDDDAFAVGLTCGGIIDIFVERVDRRPCPKWPRAGRSVTRAAGGGGHRDRARRPDATRQTHIRVAGPASVAGSVRSGSTTRWPTTPAACWPGGRTGTLHYGSTGQRRGEGMAVFVNSFEPPPADAGVRCHRLRGRDGADGRVPRLPGHGVRRRPGVRHASRFPDADEVVVDWPHRYLTAEARRVASTRGS